MKMSIGVDLHKTQFTVCVLSADRKVDESGIYPTSKLGYKAFFTKMAQRMDQGYQITTAVESTGNTRYFRNQLLQAGIGVKVVNTMKFKVVTESVKKTDKRDARTLAEFLEKDMLPESILCSQESEDIRRVIKSRAILVKALVSLKNQVHGLLLGYGIESKRGQLQSKKERQRILCGLEDHRSYGNAASAAKPLLASIDQLACQIKQLEQVLAELVAEDEDVQLLQTMPGVGLITASTIRAYTDDINRYESAKKYAAHAGLVPWVQNSNETIRHGHITKRGPVELRTAFVQMVMGMVRYQKVTSGYRIMTKYKDMKKHKGAGKSIIATARKMSTITYAILKSRSPFDPTKMMAPIKKKAVKGKEEKSVAGQRPLALAG
jgi:transposase